MADEILRERRGHVEVLTINRPEARNAINRATAVALGAALDDCESDPDVWVVVLTAAGDKAFSAGMDLKAFAAGEFPITEQGFGGLTKRAFTKPLIAAANGSALAGGFEMMISCDMVVAAEHAKFGIPEASRGLVAGAGGLIRLAKLIPLAVAYEMALTADRARQPGGTGRAGPGGRSRPRRAHREERPTRRAHLERHHASIARTHRGRSLAGERRGLRGHRCERGRDGGCSRLRREARTQLAGPVTTPEESTSGEVAATNIIRTSPGEGRRGDVARRSPAQYAGFYVREGEHRVRR